MKTNKLFDLKSLYYNDFIWKKMLPPYLRSLCKRDLARMKESTAGQAKWLVAQLDLHTK